jgi:SnoaL-like domain
MDDERAVQQVLARYVRAADHRDEAAMASLFIDDGVVEIFYNNAGVPEKIAQLGGRCSFGGPAASATTMQQSARYWLGTPSGRGSRMKEIP